MTFGVDTTQKTVCWRKQKKFSGDAVRELAELRILIKMKQFYGGDNRERKLMGGGLCIEKFRGLSRSCKY